MNNFCEQILDILKNYVRKYHNNNVRQAAQALGLSEPTLAQWLKGTRSRISNPLVRFSIGLA